MITCRRASELASASLDRKLRYAERIAFAIHALMCRVCRSYRRHLRFLQRACRELENHVSDEIVLSDAARERIRAGIERSKGRYTDTPH